MIPPCQESERRPGRGVAVGPLLALALALLATACNRGALSSDDDAGGGGQIGIDAATDLVVVAADAGLDAAGGDAGLDASADVGSADGGGADGDVAISCGGMTCAGTDLCVTFTLCGGPLTCMDLPADNQCPSGTTFTPVCPPGNRPGCLPDCTTSNGCAPRPAACGATTIDCTCAAAVCGGAGMCAFASGRDVICANQ